MVSPVKIAFTGHIDHGKSTLIGRLLYETKSLPMDIVEVLEKSEQKVNFAHIADHLREEHEQSITIDSTQLFLKHNDRQYTIIDNPGHREFLKNMITGTSQADAAVLMIDADEGILEQTKRHVYILSLLGISQLIVVINKMDKVDYAKDTFTKLSEEITGILNEKDINPVHIIPVSAIQGDNCTEPSKYMEWFDGSTCIECFETLQPTSTEKLPFRMPVQDIYKVDGEEIIVGRIESGKIQQGDKIVSLPDSVEYSVDEIVEFESNVTSALAGESIGLKLNGNGEHPKRGDILCEIVSPPDVSSEIKGTIFWMDKDPLKLDSNILFRCTTQAIKGSITEISSRIDSSEFTIIENNAQEINQFEAGNIQIKLNTACVTDEFNAIPPTGRFVLEKNGNICAAGIVSSTD